MKTVFVPAQMTTIEDKIAGNLNLSQLLLLVSPILINLLLYVLLPKQLKLTFYKLLLMFFITLVCFGLAIRIKNKLVLNWLLIARRYCSSPRYFLFDKNNLYLRHREFATNPSTNNLNETKPRVVTSELSRLSTEESIKLRAILEDPKTSLGFRLNRGGKLNVSVTEIE
ncbi:MAG: hypothetical protein NVS1B10_07750 [Candidatus Saccharimonadales bacterium]